MKKSLILLSILLLSPSAFAPQTCYTAQGTWADSYNFEWSLLQNSEGTITGSVRAGSQICQLSDWSVEGTFNFSNATFTVTASNPSPGGPGCAEWFQYTGSIAQPGCHTGSDAVLSTLVAQVAGRRSLFVQQPRPIAKALDSLEVRHAWRITYEDPPYIHESDVEDRTIRQFSNSSLRALTPRAGQINVDYLVSPKTGKPDNPAALIQLVLDAHVVNRNPGVFRVVQGAHVFHVIPAQVKDARGVLTAVKPILDVSISLPEKDRTGAEMLQAVCSAVREATGTNVEIFTAPTNLLFQHRSRQGAKNEIAREVLLRSLEATGRKLSWRLFFDPGIKTYALNVHIAKYEVPSPAGGKILRELP